MYQCGKRYKNKFRNLRLIPNAENGSKNSLTENTSQPRGKLGSFPKIPIEKMRFQLQKYEKYSKSKNDIKKPLGLFNKEL